MFPPSSTAPLTAFKIKLNCLIALCPIENHLSNLILIAQPITHMAFPNLKRTAAMEMGKGRHCGCFAHSALYVGRQPMKVHV